MVTDYGKYLTFYLGCGIYGLPIQKAREIIGMMEITRIPKAKSYIKGVMNLRGKIIPIIDLRIRFGMDEKEYSERTCVIVIEVKTPESRRLVGVAVDTVSEVANIQQNEVEVPPQYEGQIGDQFLMGLGKIKDNVILILDIERIVNHQDLSSLQQEVTQEQ
jgi:purine-binding chemotaxis protein CheW